MQVQLFYSVEKTDSELNRAAHDMLQEKITTNKKDIKIKSTLCF